MDRCPVIFEDLYEGDGAKKNRLQYFVLLRKRAFLLWWYSSPIGRQRKSPLPAP
jgi:hypothetical protein